MSQAFIAASIDHQAKQMGSLCAQDKAGKGPLVDVFGQVLTQQPREEVTCVHCGRRIAASRCLARSSTTMGWRFVIVMRRVICERAKQHLSSGITWRVVACL